MAFESLKLLKEHGRQEIFLSLANVSGTSRLLVGASDGNLYDIDPLAEKPVFKRWPGHTSYVTGVAVAGDTVVSGGYDCTIIFRKLEGDETVREVRDAHARWIRKIVASPDGRTVASVADDMVCRLWNAETGELIRELRGHEARTPHHFPSMLYSCAFSADGQKLATIDKVGHVCLWTSPTVRSCKRWRRRVSTPGIPSSEFTLSAEHDRSPSRPTASDWQSAALD